MYKPFLSICPSNTFLITRLIDSDNFFTFYKTIIVYNSKFSLKLWAEKVSIFTIMRKLFLKRITFNIAWNENRHKMPPWYYKNCRKVSQSSCRKILDKLDTNSKHHIHNCLYYLMYRISIFRDVFSNNKVSKSPLYINKKKFFFEF